MTLSIQSFAKLVGEVSRKTREASLPFHKAYVKATPEQRDDLRTRWLIGHISGNLKVSEEVAERILSQTRTERSKASQAAYAKASSDFGYHVSRGHKDKAKQAEQAKPASKKRIDKATREAATQFFEQFEGKNRTARIDAAIAVLRAMR